MSLIRRNAVRASTGRFGPLSLSLSGLRSVWLAWQLPPMRRRRAMPTCSIGSMRTTTA